MKADWDRICSVVDVIFQASEVLKDKIDYLKKKRHLSNGGESELRQLYAEMEEFSSSWYGIWKGIERGLLQEAGDVEKAFRNDLETIAPHIAFVEKFTRNYKIGQNGHRQSLAEKLQQVRENYGIPDNESAYGISLEHPLKVLKSFDLNAVVSAKNNGHLGFQ